MKFLAVAVKFLSIVCVTIFAASASIKKEDFISFKLLSDGKNKIYKAKLLPSLRKLIVKKIPLTSIDECSCFLPANV